MKNSNIKKSMAVNSFWNFIASIINRFGSLIFTVIITRLLLPENYGIYSIAFSTAMIFATFANLGIDGTLLRYISNALARDKNKISSYYRHLLRIKIIITLLASFILLFLSYPLAIYFFKDANLFLPLVVSAFYVFTLAFEGFYTQVFISLEKLNLISIKEAAGALLRIPLTLLVLYLFTSSYKVVGVFLAITLTSACLILLSIFYLKKLIPQMFYKNAASIDAIKVNRFAKFYTITSISAVVFSYVDAITLGFFLSSEYVGYYRAAFSLVFGAVGLLSFPSVLFLPIFTKLKAKRSVSIVGEVFRYFMILSIPATIGMILLGKYFIILLFGEAYLPALLPLYFLAIAILPMVSISLFSSLFSADEKPEVFTKLILTSSIMNIILNIIFIKTFILISPSWATAGAALATSISWIYYFFSAIFVSKKQFKLSIHFGDIIKPVISGVVMALSLCLFLYAVEDMNLISGLSAILIGIIVYFSSMALLKGIKKRDLELVKLVVKR